MTEESKLDPPWKVALRLSVKDAAWKADPGTFNITVVAGLEDAILAAVLPHMETSYRTGRMAGASASAKRLAQKNLELSKKVREAPERATKAIWALKSPEPSGSEHYRAGWADGLEAAIDALRAILGDES